MGIGTPAELPSDILLVSGLSHLGHEVLSNIVINVSINMAPQPLHSK